MKKFWSVALVLLMLLTLNVLAVQAAEEDLFSAYNTYCWAVEHGILN